MHYRGVTLYLYHYFLFLFFGGVGGWGVGRGEIHFLQSHMARTLSVTTGLVARIHSSHCHHLTSIFDQELKSCFKPLQAEATRDQSLSLGSYRLGFDSNLGEKPPPSAEYPGTEKIYPGTCP